MQFPQYPHLNTLFSLPICMTLEFSFKIISLHSLQIKEGDQVTLLEPNYRSVDFSRKEKVSLFKTIIQV